MTVCFTGHRTINGQYYDRENYTEHWLAVWQSTVSIVHRLWQQGHKDFISGGALGFDQLAANAVLYIKNHQVDINLWMALPFPGFERKWPAKSQTALVTIVGQADHMFYIDPQSDYKPWKMQKRNKWMVDNSQYVVGLYLDDKTGGTLNCLKYVMSKYRPFMTLHPLTRIITKYEWDAVNKQYTQAVSQGGVL